MDADSGGSRCAPPPAHFSKPSGMPPRAITARFSNLKRVPRVAVFRLRHLFSRLADHSLWTAFRLFNFLVSQSPNAQQRSTSVIEVANEIHGLEILKSPRQHGGIAGTLPDRHNPTFIAGTPKRVEQFPPDPFGAGGLRRQNHKKPIAPRERLADFIVPLLRAEEICLAVPYRHSVLAEHLSDSRRESAIVAGM